MVSSVSCWEIPQARTAARAPTPGIHLLLKQEAPRIFANVVHQFEKGVIAPFEIICRAR